MNYYSDHRPYGYTYHADIYCGKCGATLPEIDPEGNDKHPIMSWELNDHATEYEPTCAKCNTPINEWIPA